MNCRRALPTGIGAVLFLLSPSAFAHQMNVAYLDVRDHPDGFELQLAIDPHSTPLAAHIDIDGDGVVSAAEATQAQKAMIAFTFGRIHAETPRGDCSPEPVVVDPLTDLGVWQARARFVCPTPGSQAQIAVTFLADMPGDFKAVVRTTGQNGALKQQLLDTHDFVIDARQQDWLRQARRYVALGVWHIWSGLDHVAFVIGLVLGAAPKRGERRRFSPLVLALTAFTVAHSVTLILAGLDIAALSSRIVEPAIALSIAAVAAANLKQEKINRVWPRVSFAFACGLIHGLGFADLLRQAHLRGAVLVTSLLSFNVGIELGQLAIVVPMFFLSSRLPQRFRLIADAVLCVFGLAWATLRLSGL